MFMHTPKQTGTSHKRRNNLSPNPFLFLVKSTGSALASDHLETERRILLSRFLKIVFTYSNDFKKKQKQKQAAADSRLK